MDYMTTKFTFSNKRFFVLNSAYVLFKGVFIGFKCIVLLYIVDVVSTLTPNDTLLIPCIFGLINGFVDALLISMKSTIINKILSCVIGIIVACYIFLLSFYWSLPDVLADYFVYGEGGGGLEPGGWFGFWFVILIYLGTSLIVGFPISMLLLSKKHSGFW
jgi:hypothetical protein